MNGYGYSNGDDDPVCTSDKKKKYTGRYKGTVVSNLDPDQEGRLMVMVPDVLGDDPCIWAESASPLAGMGMGLYFVPPVGAGVWVEFQQGDTDYAIWTGCWRGAATDLPAAAKTAPPATPPIILGTEGQNYISVSDVPGATGGIQLMTNSGAFIAVTQAGIFINNGRGAVITLTGTAVDINGGGLTVLK
jgi:uncharacterized protein involved in type VI secretion and phage assembly